MAVVYIPTILSSLTGAKSPVEVDGATVRQIIDNLDHSWPGIRDRLISGDRLRPNISVAVDGEISPLGLLERVSPESEIHFVAAISGGSPAAPVELLIHNRPRVPAASAAARREFKPLAW